MNTAVIKLNKIKTTDNGLKGSVHIAQEDIVTLIAAKVTKKITKNPKRKLLEEDKDDAPPKKKISKGPHPWLKYFKVADGIKYKIGDTKEFKGNNFHYCDTPTHRDRIKWHTHSATDYTVRKKWLRKQEEEGASESSLPEANVHEVGNNTSRNGNEEDDQTLQQDNDVNALLATAMNLVTDNNIVRDYIANTINVST